jgi:dTDP-4-amino-4,6-dideoxygalactose transaminase
MVVKPFVFDGGNHAYHQYTIRCNERDKLIKFLKKNEIGFGIYYPKPLHYYPHLEKFGHKDLKVSEKLSGEVVSIPVHPALEKEDIEKVVDVINKACRYLDK